MALNRIVVTLGPSLRAEEACDIVPSAVVVPPIAAGDAGTYGLTSGDTLVVLDGLFLSSRAVRHKELLELLERGITVVGASSMGALRAAELDRQGVIGIGHVYREYASGRIVSDDEVALTHDESTYRALTYPMVDLRFALRSAVRSGSMTAHTARAVADDLVSIYFALRSKEAVHRVLAAHAAQGMRFPPSAMTESLTHPSGSIKRRDAIEALTALRNTAPVRTRPAQSSPPTTFARAWRRSKHTPDWARTDLEAVYYLLLATPCGSKIYRRCAILSLFAESYGYTLTDDPAHDADVVSRLSGAAIADLGDAEALDNLILGRRSSLGLSETIGTDHLVGLWRGEPRFDWVTPLLPRLLSEYSCPPPAPLEPGSDNRLASRLLLAWGIQPGDQDAIRARGLVDTAELAAVLREYPRVAAALSRQAAESSTGGTE